MNEYDRMMKESTGATFGYCLHCNKRHRWSSKIAEKHNGVD